MRLGKDAMVFTRCMTSMSVGFLSQTYLEATKADAVIVPIVTWNLPSNILFFYISYGPLRDKTCLRGFGSDHTKTSLLSYRD